MNNFRRKEVVFMHDNNQYPNEYPNQNKTESNESTPYSNYNFSNTNQSGGNADTQYQNYYGSVPPLNEEGKAAKKNRAEAAHKNPGKVGNYMRKAFVCASLGLFFGLCAGVGFYAVSQSVQTEKIDNTSATTSALPQVEETPTTTAVSESTKEVIQVSSDVTGVVKDVMPAMVSIGNQYTEQYSYFGQTFSQEGQSVGSGIIVGENDTELLIVTNYHVIQNAEKLAVTFIDNTVAEAQLKGSNANMDLAVLAVPLDSLSAETRAQIVIAEMGDSNDLTLGEPVIAIGNALGYGQSVTNGIVSALDREIQLSNEISGTFIQTNAAINPGNSGGALLNLSGEVIGINSNKIGGDTIEGMGYAIPISAAKPIITELMLKETKIKVDESEIGYIGIQPATVTDQIASLYGMPLGVYITQVLDGSPAEEAGLIKGDIITAINDDTINSYEDLQEAMQYHKVGEQITVTVQRTGNEGYQELQFTLTLGNKSN